MKDIHNGSLDLTLIQKSIKIIRFDVNFTVEIMKIDSHRHDYFKRRNFLF